MGRTFRYRADPADRGALRERMRHDARIIEREQRIPEWMRRARSHELVAKDYTGELRA